MTNAKVLRLSLVTAALLLASGLAAAADDKDPPAQPPEAAASAAAALLSKRAKLETLEREKAARQLQLASRSAELDTRLAKMARDAQDLRDLFAKLAEEKAKWYLDQLAANKMKVLPPPPALPLESKISSWVEVL